MSGKGRFKAVLTAEDGSQLKVIGGQRRREGAHEGIAGFRERVQLSLRLERTEVKAEDRELRQAGYIVR